MVPTPATRASGGLLGLITQYQQLVFRDGELGVGAALTIGKFDFKHAGCQGPHDRAHLAAQQTLVGQIAGPARGSLRRRIGGPIFPKTRIPATFPPRHGAL